MFLNYKMLSNGITDANRRLADLCGGEPLVQIDNRLDWIYCPNECRLTYTVRDGAPEDAVERAERICRRYSYHRLLAPDFPADPRPANGWPVFDLWHAAGMPVDADEAMLNGYTTENLMRRAG